ncbi:MAG: phosphate butyryltransferase [Tissierellia bacterium]|nr:phosphate butyryltransferase [Tissierellia bacterium]
MKSLTELFIKADNLPKSRVVVAAAQEEATLNASLDAFRRGWIDLTLVGDLDKIRSILSSAGMDCEDIRLIKATTLEEAAVISVREISEGRGDILLKGLVDTSILLKAVLNKEAGLRKSSLLSHFMVYEVPSWNRLVALSDGGMNTHPDLPKKKAILDNALEAMQKLGYMSVKTCLLAAKEKPDPSMPATVEAAELASMYDDSPHIVEGPMALDLALSRESAEVKKYSSRISGEVDLFIVSSIEVGNVLGKAFTLLAGAQSAGVILGASIPVLVVSRSDSRITKLYSIALGKVLASNERSGR